ncbi:hypothetical protein [Ancylobacter mangrovi]|uniref:hypothetical protein n=1 Tax=Ancylobacter mangrovi TaxID=2972472 RepID=UPI0021610F7D|nr:hypothetical protein [Ancylobacter mangrovi]MCS0501238.1 hypothetical protein [Ancylobacter mangrovi]
MTDELDVALLDLCMCQAWKQIPPEIKETYGAVNPRELRLKLAHAVIEGAEIFAGDADKIVAFALFTLPSLPSAFGRLHPASPRHLDA